MRITGRQLRRIIQEEVERMMNEENGSVVGSTGTQAVKPMVVKGNPNFEQDMKRKATRQLAYLLAALTTFDKNQNIALTLNEGDKIEAMIELTSITDKSYVGGRLEIEDLTSWKITGFNVNGVNKDALLPPRFKSDRGAGRGNLATAADVIPPNERMKYRVSMTVPASVEDILDDKDYGQTGSMTPIVDTYFMALKDSITAI